MITTKQVNTLQYNLFYLRIYAMRKLEEFKNAVSIFYSAKNSSGSHFGLGTTLQKMYIVAFRCTRHELNPLHINDHTINLK